LVRDSHTDTLRVEVGSVGAFEALSTVPGSTENIISAIERICVDLTDSTVQHVSSIAGKTSSSAFAPSGAEVADDLADSIGIFPPSLGADGADVTVPESAAQVLGGDFAAVADNGITLVALEADSLGLVELTAEGRNFAADSILVEVVASGAFGALSIDPSLAAKVVSDSNDVAKGDAGVSRVEAAEVSVEGAEGELSVR
jgi:hypothetical protein